MSGSISCPPSLNGFAFEWAGRNLPYCAINCDIQELVDNGVFSFDGACDITVEEIVTHEIEDPTCLESQMHDFSEATNYGQPLFYSDSGVVCSYSTSDGSIDGVYLKETCDYSVAGENMKGPCAQEGGTLISFDAIQTNQRAIINNEERYKNIPVCISNQCDPNMFIKEYGIPFMRFDVSYEYELHSPRDRIVSLFESGKYKIDFNTTFEKENAKFAMKINGKVTAKKCKWLKKQTKKMIKKYCGSKKFQVYSKRYLPASRVCQETCASIYVKESKKAMFTSPVFGKPKSCNWLQKQSPELIDEICTLQNPAPQAHGNADEVCTKTCGTKFVPPKCIDNLFVGDGACDKESNNPECNFDGGDCVKYNMMYPQCDADEPFKVGNGYCNPEYNTPECGFDGGDCQEVPSSGMYPNCFVPYPELIGDGYCQGGAYNTKKCGYDGGDCDFYNEFYSSCHVMMPGAIGDGYCNEWDDIYNLTSGYNSTECEYDGGDCLYFNYTDDDNHYNNHTNHSNFFKRSLVSTIESVLDTISLHVKIQNWNGKVSSEIDSKNDVTNNC